MTTKSVKNIFTISIGLFFIISVLQFIPINFQVYTNVSAESSLIYSSKLDYNSSSIDNVTISSNGEIKLALINRSIEDNFVDSSKISYQKNLIINITLNEASLKKDFNEFYGRKSDTGHDIKVTPDGGYIIAASTRSYGAGREDAWIIKIDEFGNKQWDKTFGGSLSDWPYLIQNTPDNGFVFVGVSRSYGIDDSGDIWLTKINENGIEEWNRTYGSNEYDRGFSIQITTDGGFIIVGEVSCNETGVGDLWLIKTDANGNELWNKTFGGIHDEGGHYVRQTPDNGYIITGHKTLFYKGRPDLWLIKTDPEGNELWNKTFGGSSREYGISVQLCSDNGYLIMGETDSLGPYNYIIWVIKTDSKGNEQWNRTYNGINFGWGDPIQQTLDGGYVFTGQTWSNISDSNDIWLVKIDQLGIIEWDKKFGSEDKDDGASIQLTSDGGYVITGHGGHGGYKTSTDVFFLKIDSQGNVQYTNGELCSNNLLSEQYVATIDSFNCNVSIPIRTNLEIQFSQDNEEWFNSNEDLNKWVQLSNGFNSINLSALEWNGPNFHYRLKFTSEGINAPAMNYINLTFSQYVSSGTLESVPIENNINDFLWNYLNWTSIKPQETTIKFQLRSANSETKLLSTNFVGPDGKASTYYTLSLSNIWEGHSNDKWLQYKVFLSTNNPTDSPIMNEVRIGYNSYQLVIIETPEAIQQGNISIKYELFDFDSEPDICKIIPEYSLDNITFFPATEGHGGDGKTGLISLDRGISHDFIWASEIDLNNMDVDTVYFRITPQDTHTGLSDTTNAFHVDNEAPSIISTFPENDANNIDVEVNITATFQEPVFKQLAEDLFSSFPAIEGEFSWDNNTIIFNPKFDLSYNTTYTILIDQDVKDEVGNRISQPYIWNFTTVKLFDRDGDGYSDYIDVFPDNPLYHLDTDQDGIPDAWEDLHNLSKTNPKDAEEDFDDDEKPNLDEFIDDTDPWVEDIIEKEEPDYSYLIIINIIILIIIICLVLIKLIRKKGKDKKNG